MGTAAERIMDAGRRLAGNRLAALTASGALLLVFGAAAASVFPFATGMPRPELFYRLSASQQADVARAPVPVFTVRTQGPAVRSGVADVGPDGTLQVAPFTAADAPSFESDAVLLPVSVRTLWALASDAERRELKETARRFAAALGDALDAALSSPAFTREYEPALAAILNEAFSRAWNTEAVQHAFADTLRVADPVLRHTFAESVQPVLVERVRPAVWRVIRDNALNYLDPFTEFQLDLSPIESAVTATFADRRVRAGLASTVPVVAGLPQTHRLVQAFALEAARRLRADDRLSDLAARLLGDERFSVYFASLGDPALALVRAAPRNLAQLDEQADLNSLAAHIFKAQARGRGGYVLLYMTQDQFARLAAVDPALAVPLARVTTP